MSRIGRVGAFAVAGLSAVSISVGSLAGGLPAHAAQIEPKIRTFSGFEASAVSNDGRIVMEPNGVAHNLDTGAKMAPAGEPCWNVAALRPTMSSDGRRAFCNVGPKRFKAWKIGQRDYADYFSVSSGFDTTYIIAGANATGDAVTVEARSGGDGTIWAYDFKGVRVTPRVIDLKALAGAGTWATRISDSEVMNRKVVFRLHSVVDDLYDEADGQDRGYGFALYDLDDNTLTRKTVTTCGSSNVLQRANVVGTKSVCEMIAWPGLMRGSVSQVDVLTGARSRQELRRGEQVEAINRVGIADVVVFHADQGASTGTLLHVNTRSGARTLLAGGIKRFHDLHDPIIRSSAGGRALIAASSADGKAGMTVAY